MRGPAGDAVGNRMVLSNAFAVGTIAFNPIAFDERQRRGLLTAAPLCDEPVAARQ